MVFQACFLSKSDATLCTSERLRSAVHHHVRFKISFASESLFTVRTSHLSFDCLLAGVHAYVSSQTTGTSKLSTTVDTKKFFFDSLMNQLKVLHQSLLSFEPFSTVLHTANEWFFTENKKIKIEPQKKSITCCDVACDL